MSESQLIEDWRQTFTNLHTEQDNISRLRKFLEFAKMKPEVIKELSPYQAQLKFLRYQKFLKNFGASNNSIRAYLSTVKCFMDFCGIPIGKPTLKKIVKSIPKNHYHNFTTDDIKKLYFAGTKRDKALISTLASSGFSIADILGLDKEYVRKYIERSKLENEDFVFIRMNRIKTGSEALFVLNPIAIRSIQDFLNERGDDGDKRLFNIKYSGIPKLIKRLSKRGGVNNIDECRIHKIRSWSMNQLNSSGANIFVIKRIVGKKIPQSDGVYLTNLNEDCKKHYKKAYPEFLDFLHERNQKNMILLKERSETQNHKLEDLNQKLINVTELLHETIRQGAELAEQNRTLRQREKERLKEKEETT